MQQIETIKSNTFAHAHQKPAYADNHTKPRTWIIAVKETTIELFEEVNGIITLIDQLNYAQDKAVNPAFCAATQNKNALLKYNQGLYMEKNSAESLNIAHKIAAKMDEALWQGRFDFALIIAKTNMARILYDHLSVPVQARTRLAGHQRLH